MRAALLPTPGDPHLLAFWLLNMQEWRVYVDRVFIWVDGIVTPEVAAMLNRPDVSWNGGTRLGHPGAINVLLNMAVAADVVMLCEDDAYVRHPGAVEAAFKVIEDGALDVIGSPRQENYWDSTIETEWPPLAEEDFAKDGFKRGLWPAFLFAKRDSLVQTDRNFADRTWYLGEEVYPGVTVTPELCKAVGIADDHIHLDVMFSTTFQLRAAGLRIGLVNRVRTFDARATEEWVKFDPPWFHVTGLSTLNDALSGRTDLPDMDEHGGLWTRRVAWWMRVANTQERLDALWEFCDRNGISDAAVDEWVDRMEPWVTW